MQPASTLLLYAVASILTQGLFGGSHVIGTAELIETPALEFKEFTGALQGSTIQLHNEVWEALNTFCEKRKVSKKVVVNGAINRFVEGPSEPSNDCLHGHSIIRELSGRGLIMFIPIKNTQP